MKKLAFFAGCLFLVALGLEVVGNSVYASHKKSGNQGQVYRLPWREYDTSNRSGYGPGQGDRGAGAVAFAFYLDEPVKSIADGDVVTAHDTYCLGKTVEIDHVISGQTTRRSRYSHLNGFAVSEQNPAEKVTQGQVVGYANDSGSEDNYTPPAYTLCSDGTHLHFDLRQNGTSVAWGSGGVPSISQRAVSDFVSSSNVEQSNNAGAAMWGDGGVNLSTIYRTAYLNSGGWALRGSTSRMESTYEVCNGTGNKRIIWGCSTQFGDIHFQTFRGTDGRWRNAFVNPYRGSDGAVYNVSIAFFAAYTDQYDANRVWSWVVGAPTSGWIDLGSGVIRQSFEGNYYMVWTKSICRVNLFDGGDLIYTWQGSRYCDNGGDAPSAGYGSDSD